MKKIAVAISLCLLAMLATAVGQAQSIRIHTHSGVSEFNISDIDSITFGGAVNDSSLSEGLMLYMPFDGNLSDASGNNNNGSSPGELYTSNRFGDPNKAYKFNGIGNYITIPNSASLNPTDAMSISFWIRVDNVAWNVSQLVSKTDGDVESQREYLVELKANYQYPYYKLWGAIPGGGVKELDGGASLVQQWHHFVGIIDRKSSHTMKLFIDGVQTDILDDATVGFVPNTHALYLGAGEGSWESTSIPDCTMDELRIYSRALSPAEVTALYNLH